MGHPAGAERANIVTGPLLPFSFTVPAALLAFATISWYGLAIRKRGLPRSRRRIRKASTFIHLVLVPALVYALSVADPQVSATRYVLSWMIVLLLTCTTLFLAVLDIFNNIRLHQIEKRLLARDLGLRAPVESSDDAK